MPEGTAVDRTYKALLKEGKSEESAARIAQAQTGEALATGKPPKHKEENCSLENSILVEITLGGVNYFKLGKTWYARHGNEEKEIIDRVLIDKLNKMSVQNSFQNGSTRALNYIMNRAERVGVRLGNTWNGEDVKLSTGKTITHKRAQNGSWDVSPVMTKEEYAEYLQKRKGY